MGCLDRRSTRNALESCAICNQDALTDQDGRLKVSFLFVKAQHPVTLIFSRSLSTLGRASRLCPIRSLASASGERDIECPNCWPRFKQIALRDPAICFRRPEFVQC